MVRHRSFVGLACFVCLVHGRRSPESSSMSPSLGDTPLHSKASAQENVSAMKAFGNFLLVLNQAHRFSGFQLPAGKGPLSRLAAGSRSPASTMMAASAEELPSSFWPLCDLTPAIDKFVCYPEKFRPLSRFLDFFKNLFWRFWRPALRTLQFAIADIREENGWANDFSGPFGIVEQDLKELKNNATLKVRDSIYSESELAASYKSTIGQDLPPAAVVLLVARTLSDGKAPSQNQLSLAQITEMYTASLWMHEKVELGKRNHETMLGGDDLLSRSAVALAKLQNSQVVDLMANALDSMGQGSLDARSMDDLSDVAKYVRKCYFKTALIPMSCKSAALLAGYEEQDKITKAVEEYGCHLGIASRIMFEIRNYEDPSAVRNIINPRVVAGPLLFANQADSSMKPLIERGFSESDDVSRALEISHRTPCVVKAYRLAQFNARRGVEALKTLPPSKGRDALEKLMGVVVPRRLSLIQR